jgi:predicted AlkP superfamily phosphohydrolase/phosphomutase
MKNYKRKVFILGIDGATFDVIHPLINKGKLHNFNKVIECGTHGNLDSTIPPLSAPAWIGFMTGKNPGHYGAYHFRDIDITNPQNFTKIELINSSFYKGDTFFDYLGEIGYRVGLMTIPVTYPPWKVNGFLVSGYPCPDPSVNTNFTYPSKLSNEIPDNLNWTEDVNSDLIPKQEYRGANNPEDILQGGLSMMKKRTNYTFELMKRYNCDVTVLVWGAIDRAQHVLWKYHDTNHSLYQPENRYKTYIEDLYLYADQLLSKIINQLRPYENLFILSDHGFGPRQGHFFHLNAWLNQEGYLKANYIEKLRNNFFANSLKPAVHKFVKALNQTSSQKLAQVNQQLVASGVDFSKTQAFMYPIHEQTVGLVINLKERQPFGIVSSPKYESLRDQLIKKLKEILDHRNGAKVIKKCYKREELYRGSEAEKAPDIIIVLNDNYYGGTRAFGKIFSNMHHRNTQTVNGTHRHNGIFLAYGKDIDKGKEIHNASIIDVAPTVIHSLKEKIPRDIEGKVLTSVFTKDYAAEKIRYMDRKDKSNPNHTHLSKDDKDSMIKNLKQLGYL